MPGRRVAQTVVLALVLAVAGCVKVRDGEVSVGIYMPFLTPGVTALPEEGAPLAVSGPYEVIAEPAFGSPYHVVYRPTSLDRFPELDTLPVVAWAGGGCSDGSEAYAGYLSTLASYGFLVIARAEAGRTAAPENVIAAIDWAAGENARENSPLRDKIAADEIAVMGQSCGGILAIATAPDPRIDALGVWNVGLNRTGSLRTRWKPRDLTGLHTPTLYVTGGENDHGDRSAQADFEAIDHVPVFYGARRDGGHFGTMLHSGGGEFANVGAAWLLWRLKGDEAAGALFAGADCELCTNSNWEVHRKGWE
jgi:predicted alpha/beta-hydrolase family hydrolase